MFGVCCLAFVVVRRRKRIGMPQRHRAKKRRKDEDRGVAVGQSGIGTMVPIFLFTEVGGIESPEITADDPVMLVWIRRTHTEGQHQRTGYQNMKQ
jgi:hypothetical protein